MNKYNEIIVILGEELKKCNNELKKLPPVSIMLEDSKNKLPLAKYYAFSAQKCLLQKLQRDVRRIIKKEKEEQNA